jgi:hypothetical protein
MKHLFKLSVSCRMFHAKPAKNELQACSANFLKYKFESVHFKSLFVNRKIMFADLQKI